MFGGSITKFSRSAPAVVDNIPDAVNWTDVTYDELADTYTYAKQRITGISSYIIIKPVKTTGTATADLYYKISNTDDSYSGEPVSNGFQKINSGNTFNASNNQYVYFSVKKSDGFSMITGTNTYSIKNNSDSDTELDTIQITYSFEL